MALEEDIDKRALQIEELMHIWAHTHKICRTICSEVDQYDEERRKKYWLNLARTNHTVQDLTELIDMCSQPDPYERYRGY